MNAQEAAENAARNLAAIEQAKFTAQEVVDALVPQPSEEERLGKLAYEAYHDDAIVGYGGMPGSTIAVKWSDQGSSIRQHWIAAAKAVAERVLAEVQASAEQSE